MKVLQWSPMVSICLYIQSLSVLIPSVDPCRKLKMPILPIYIPVCRNQYKNAYMSRNQYYSVRVFHGTLARHQYGSAVIIVILQQITKWPTFNDHISATIGPLTEILASEFNSFCCLQVLYGALLHQSKIEKMNRSLKIDSF